MNAYNGNGRLVELEPYDLNLSADKPEGMFTKRSTIMTSKEYDPTLLKIKAVKDGEESDVISNAKFDVSGRDRVIELNALKKFKREYLEGLIEEQIEVEREELRSEIRVGDGKT